MKILAFGAAAAALLAAAPAASGAVDDSYPMNVNPRAWVMDQAAFADPVKLKGIHWPEDDLDDLAGRPKTAVSFSGGGTRAFVAGLGYLRALIDLGLMPSIRYISGVSGGSWASSAFTFFQKKYTDSIPFYLGNISDPADLTMDALKDIPAGCGRRSVVDHNLIEVALGLLVKSDKFSQIWRDAVYKVYLEPAGVPKEALVTWDEHTLNDIRKRNPELANRNITWAMPCDGNCAGSVVGRPFPLFGGTLLGPQSLVPFDMQNRSYTMHELTPLYTGQAVVQNVTYYGQEGILSKHKEQTVLVGGFTEAFAFSSLPPLAGLSEGTTAGILQNATLTEQGTTIEDMAGISSWALADFVSTLLPLAKHSDITLPTWSPAAGAGSSPPSVEFNFGDGGCLDNLNLASILRRGVDRVVMFYTSSHPLSPADKWNPFNQTSAKEISDNVDSEFPAYFGHDVDPGGNKSFGWDYSRNGFFQQSDFAPTIAKLQAAQATGRGAVATTPLTTVRNDWFGIPAGLQVNVTWVYLSRASAWENDLPEETRKHVVPLIDGGNPAKTTSTGPFKGFPHYSTFGMLHLTSEQSNLLADFSGWIVRQNNDTFQAALGMQ